MDTASPLEDLEIIVSELPYWMREVHGKYIIDRLRKFVIDHGGEKSPVKNSVAKPRSS